MAATISSIPRLQSPTLTQDWDVDGISTLSRRDLTLPGNNNRHIPKICEKYARTLQDIIDLTNHILRFKKSPLNHNHDQNLDDGCQNIRSSFSKGLLSNTVRIDERKSVESPPLRQVANPHVGVFRYDDNTPRELRTYTRKYKVLGTYADNVYRKWNEQIRPALRSRRHHRSSGTLPLYKSVRFDSALENILYFHELDRPFDVRKDTSPITDCDKTCWALSVSRTSKGRSSTSI
ncbi:hypothetical protein FOXG_22368 [Fusarium oxysporum f. sp. lycopersici 4287]|uniref:Uncharacterized protein n=1 Tax=Fusarium oxysporum f. sp. lycopersici (strain 4287 / CBS 123668 / FGSC 9935 / NRRL 34936) TaxID=426428 RepID=A0A0J9WV23_FUSO4|nr:hypothetical protein FOXG_22368 [Fusarium oxysporum f. sp. lycopersici 4287]KNB18782.1 hypothetical protein FOXG_22368 [Fusarium oxysporum f. sp. lycopersici 4287]